MHPLTREYWFLKFLGDLEVSPKVFSLSQSVIRSQTSTAKTSSLEMMAHEGACTKSPEKAQFRYLIMERVGESLHSYLKRPDVGGKVSVKRALELGIEMMALLEKVHSRGVVHGDIFQRNVCFKDDRLVLIDFGRAMLVHNAPPLARVDGEIHLFPLFSLWEMLGYRASFRDDVFRVLQLMAVLMNGSKYVDAMDLLSKIPVDSQGRQPLLVYKAAGFIFELPKAGLRPISRIESWAIRTKVHDGLEALLDYVRALGLDEMPDHKSIIAALQELVGFL
jgi:serine/threonine protein kinase